MSRRDEFINGLKSELGHLPYNEVEKIISFFEESIEDKLDDGLSEDEIFDQYGSFKTVADEIKEGNGFSQNKEEARSNDNSRDRILKEYVFDKAYKNIKLSDKNLGIIVKPSEDDKVRLKVYENKNCFYQISDSDDLNISYVETSESIYQSIVGSFFTSYNYTTELYIPMKSNGTDIFISNKNGSIEASDFVINNMNLTNKNGSIKASTIKGKDLKIFNINGSIRLDTCASNSIEIVDKNGKLEAFGLTCDSFDVSNKNGSIVCDDLVCGYINIENANGKIKVSDIVSKSSILLRNSYGKIEFNKAIFQTDMKAYNTAGKIEGSINQSLSDLNISLSNSSGSTYFNDKKYSNDEKFGSGDKIFSATNKAGSIKITTLK